MAYLQEYPYIKSGPPPQRIQNAERRPHDQAYINGFPENHASLDNSHVNLIYAPSDGAPPPQHAIAQPRPPQTVQVVIPSPRQMPANANVKAPHGSVDPARPAPQFPPLDYQLLLLSLAEDYFTAAHDESSMVALGRRQSDIQAYYKLVANGLGCLEAVLKV